MLINNAKTHQLEIWLMHPTQLGYEQLKARLSCFEFVAIMFQAL
jgi:hypothetical protein